MSVRAWCNFIASCGSTARRRATSHALSLDVGGRGLSMNWRAGLAATCLSSGATTRCARSGSRMRLRPSTPMTASHGTRGWMQERLAADARKGRKRGQAMQPPRHRRQPPRHRRQPRRHRRQPPSHRRQPRSWRSPPRRCRCDAKTRPRAEPLRRRMTRRRRL